MAPVLLPALLPGEPGDAVGEELVVVGTQERCLVRTPLLDGQGTSDEVRGIPHHRAPTQCLPVDDRACLVVEEDVVEPVVAVDEAERGPLIRLPGIGGGNKALTDLDMLGGDPAPIALEEAGQQRGQQCLVERVRLV